MKRIPLNPYKGFLFIRFFIGAAFESKRIKPIKRIFKVGRLILYLVAYVNPKLKTDKKFKHSYLKSISQYVTLKVWHDDENKLSSQDECMVWHDYIFGSDYWDTGRVWMLSAFYEDKYICAAEDVGHYLRLGINKFYSNPITGGNVCCVGATKDNKTWYGWSHRAIYGFKIGHVVKIGDVVCGNPYIKGCKEHKKWKPIKPGFVAWKIDDCKLLASHFAENVS